MYLQSPICIFILSGILFQILLLYNFIFLQVNFEEFKECFVAILSQDIPADDAFKANGSEDVAGLL